MFDACKLCVQILSLLIQLIGWVWVLIALHSIVCIVFDAVPIECEYFSTCFNKMKTASNWKLLFSNQYKMQTKIRFDAAKRQWKKKNIQNVIKYLILFLLFLISVWTQFFKLKHVSTCITKTTVGTNKVWYNRRNR